MKDMVASRRYARALYQLANESRELDDVLLGMANVRHAIRTAPDLLPLLVNPMVKAEDKRKLISSVTSNKLILKFIELLAVRKRLALFESIHDLLVEMSDSAKGIRHALVKSAQPLSDSQKREVEAGLAKSTGGTVLGRFEIDAALLGGVWVKMGDKVLDASLRGRLENMRHTLLHSAN